MKGKDNTNFYDNLDECHRRLMNTVVLYDGQPAFIQNIRDGFDDGVYRVYMNLLPGELRGGAPAQEDEDNTPGRVVRRKINSPKFNRFRPFQMGYANIFDTGVRHASFLSRVPSRQSRQGLSRQLLTSIIPALCTPERRHQGVQYESAITAAGFAEMVKGEFPKAEEALDLLDNDTSMAVSRKFAVQRDSFGMLFLYAGPDRVGVVRSNEILLAPNKMYLREEIQDCPNLPNQINIL